LQAFQTSPSYQFGLSQGLGSLQRQSTATGGRGSGAEKKALMNYATNLANTEYGGWQKGLQGITGIGQQSAEQAAGRAYGTGGLLSNLGFNYSGQFNDLYKSAGQVAAEAEMAKAKAQAEGSEANTKAYGSMFENLPDFGKQMHDIDWSKMFK
jgi:hypothetical protein